MDVEINNVIYMELNLGPKISNSTCGKTIDVETIDRDSTVYELNQADYISVPKLWHAPYTPEIEGSLDNSKLN